MTSVKEELVEAKVKYSKAWAGLNTAESRLWAYDLVCAEQKPHIPSEVWGARRMARGDVADHLEHVENVRQALDVARNNYVGEPG